MEEFLEENKEILEEETKSFAPNSFKFKTYPRHAETQHWEKGLFMTLYHFVKTNSDFKSETLERKFLRYAIGRE